MAWDSSRVVPWRRLVKEWAVYAVVFVAAVAVVRRDDLRAADFSWIVVSLPVWVAVSAVLAKLGYQRKTLREMRAEASARAGEQQQRTSERVGSGVASARTRPAPTKRTSTGPNRPSKPKRR